MDALFNNKSTITKCDRRIGGFGFYTLSIEEP